MEGLRYAATAGGLATICAALTRVICLWMRLRFCRHVVDLAAKTQQRLDPAEIITAVAPRVRSHLPQSRYAGKSTGMQSWSEELPDPLVVPESERESIRASHLNPGPR
jgi:hypothetical protein